MRGRPRGEEMGRRLEGRACEPVVRVTSGRPCNGAARARLLAPPGVPLTEDEESPEGERQAALFGIPADRGGLPGRRTIQASPGSIVKWPGPWVRMKGHSMITVPSAATPRGQP